MVDYVYWATVDPLTVDQAARLWVNVEPEMPTQVLASNDKKAVAARLQILKRAIIEGTLRAQSHTDDQASVGDHRSCLVQRVDLTAFARSRGEKPNFLFAPGAPFSVLLSEIEHLIADGSPLLQRAIEDALRKQRGRTGNTNQGAGEVVDDFAPGDVERMAAAWLAEEMGRRARKGKSRLRPDMIVVLRREFPDLGERAARALFTAIPDALKTRAGRKKGS
jgi:hypothetical protein